MNDTNLTFIGGGNMAASLIGGLISDGFPPARITVADVDNGRLTALAQRFGVHTTQDSDVAAGGADLVVLAVKPQSLREVAIAVAPTLARRKPLVLSVAAGVRSADLQRWLGPQTAIVRAMPNTPALVQTGATGLYANDHVRPAQRDLAESILRAVGITVWVEDEAQMDAVTALSGSGPAYFFYMMEAMETAGMTLGLPPATARLLTLQTALGAAKMALESPESLSLLRARVTSPGGTTERGVAALEAAKVADGMAAALRAAHARSQELAKLLGEG